MDDALKLQNPHRKPGSISVIAAPTGSRLYPVGSGKGRYEHPDLAYRPDAMAERLAHYYSEGLISQAHLHGRDPQTGGPTGDPEHYEALLRAIAERCPDGYLSITTTDNNMPAEHKERFGEIMARGAALRMRPEAPQPTRVPIIDALSMALADDTPGRRKNASPVRAFYDNALRLMEEKGIGFEVELPNHHLVPVAEGFLRQVERDVAAGKYKPGGAVAASLDGGPVIQILFGARENMPCTREHLNQVVDEVLAKFRPRAIQVALRGSRQDCYDPDFVEAVLDLAQQDKISGLRVGIEDTYLDANGTPVSTEALLRDVKARVERRGLHMNTPEEAKQLLSAPIRAVAQEAPGWQARVANGGRGPGGPGF